MKRNTVLEVLGFTALVCAIVVGVGLLAKTVLGDKYDARESISLSTENAGQNRVYALEKTKLDAFDGISLQVDYADVEIIPSDDYYLEYHIETSRGEPQYKVDEDGCFIFSTSRKSGLLMNFGIKIDEGQIKDYVRLYVPQDKEFNSLYVSAESGDIKLADLVAGDVQIDAEYGDITLSKLTGDNLSMNLESGDVVIDEADVTGIDIQDEYGNVKLGRLTSDNVNMRISSGNLNVQEVTADRQIDLSNEYGDIKIEKLTCTDGTMKIEDGELMLGEVTADSLSVWNEYGDVAMELADKISDYNCDFTTEYGSISVPDQNAVKEDDDVESYNSSSKKDRDITITNQSGDIRVSELQ